MRGDSSMQHLCISHHPPPAVSPRTDAGTQPAWGERGSHELKIDETLALTGEVPLEREWESKSNVNAARAVNLESQNASLVMSLFPKTASPVCLFNASRVCGILNSFLFPLPKYGYQTSWMCDTSRSSSSHVCSFSFGSFPSNYNHLCW